MHEQMWVIYPRNQPAPPHPQLWGCGMKLAIALAIVLALYLLVYIYGGEFLPIKGLG